MICTAPGVLFIVHVLPHTRREDESPVPASVTAKFGLVFDAVYTPRWTKLLTDAKAAGCEVVDGLQMFVGQAVDQFSLFTGAQGECVGGSKRGGNMQCLGACRGALGHAGRGGVQRLQRAVVLEFENTVLGLNNMPYVRFMKQMPHDETSRSCGAVVNRFADKKVALSPRAEPWS